MVKRRGIEVKGRGSQLGSGFFTHKRLSKEGNVKGDDKEDLYGSALDEWGGEICKRDGTGGDLSRGKFPEIEKG